MLARLVSAEWLRLRGYWLPRTLLALLVAVLALQVQSRLDDLAELRTEVETGLSGHDGALLTEQQVEGNRLLIAQLEQELSYPAFIGTVARLATGFGSFLVILLAAVMVGEDFGTVRAVLARGVGRVRLVVGRCLALWLAAGAGVAAVAVLAAAAGPFADARLAGGRISTAGLGDALLIVLRAWLTCLPFVAATLFWAVLARHAGPAMGIGIGIRFAETMLGLMLPLVVLTFSARGAGTPPLVRLVARLFGVTVGYNAGVVLNWGAQPTIAPQVFAGLVNAGGETLLPDQPWRSTALLGGYTLLHLGLAAWILRRRDVTSAT